jgi:hypothetical protein
MKPTLYLDVDGVFLTSWHPQAVSGAEELIEYVTSHFECYWLTSYCRGDTRPVLKLLSKYYDKETLSKLQSVKATHWRNHKTDAIDFESDFYWLDDNPSRAAMKELKVHERLDRLIVVDLSRVNELKRIIDTLKSVT